jgi:hypothetical protein
MVLFVGFYLFTVVFFGYMNRVVLEGVDPEIGMTKVLGA